MLGELNGCAAVRGGTMRWKNLEEPQNISEIESIKFENKNKSHKGHKKIKRHKKP